MTDFTSHLESTMKEKAFIINKTAKKKSHTCEEGGAHLRISFWHLLMNFEKLEISEFWRYEKKLPEIPSFYTCVPKTTIIWGTRSKTIFFLSFWAICCPLHSPRTQKFKFRKNEKSIWRCHYYKLQKTLSNYASLLR